LLWRHVVNANPSNAGSWLRNSAHRPERRSCPRNFTDGPGAAFQCTLSDGSKHLAKLFCRKKLSSLKAENSGK
jgi:hypothetical protein